MRLDLEPSKGIPRKILWMMAVVGAFTVANLYYNQPLLELISRDLGETAVRTNLITVMTQIGYALGLFFVVPMADMISRRKIIITCMVIAAVAGLVISTANSLVLIWASSVVLGLCSVTSQIFVPIAALYSLPQNKARNMGYILSGVMLGILGARVVSGYVGEWLGWRGMFAMVTVIMLVSLLVTLRMLPNMQASFQGNYKSLMRTVGSIFVQHPNIRLYAVRAAFSFGSMLAIWSCLAFHLASSPFYAGSDKVGMLGVCGLAGALTASSVGRFVPVLGIHKMSVIGVSLQLGAWFVAFLFGHTYAGLIVAIILVDIGAQFQQLSNQSGCLRELPHATNRANTIFMTIFFIGGCMGTLLAGFGWKTATWTGVCVVGSLFAMGAMLITLYERIKINQ